MFKLIYLNDEYPTTIKEMIEKESYTTLTEAETQKQITASLLNISADDLRIEETPESKYSEDTRLEYISRLEAASSRINSAAKILTARQARIPMRDSELDAMIDYIEQLESIKISILDFIY